VTRWQPVRAAWLDGPDSAAKQSSQLNAQSSNAAFREELAELVPLVRAMGISASELADKLEKISHKLAK
jgi:hypothetical protein